MSIKAPRFLREYASYCIREVKGCDYFEDEVIADKVDRINFVVNTYERGLITVHEAMDMIMRA